MHAVMFPPGQPLGVGPGGDGGAGFAGAAHVAGAVDGQVSPLASQHGGEVISSAGHFSNSSY